MEDNLKKVIVMGKGKLAIKIADWFKQNSNYNLDLVVPVIPEPKWTESLIQWAKKNNIKLIESGNYQDIVKSDDDKIDLVFSVFYDKIIKVDFIKKVKQILNIHNSPLPRYRGVRPINWALKNNEKKHGVTIHEITPGIDDGPIISQLEYSIYPKIDEVKDVYNRALEYGWILFQQTIPILDKIIPQKQDEVNATYFSNKESSKLGNRINFTIEESK